MITDGVKHLAQIMIYTWEVVAGLVILWGVVCFTRGK